MNYLKLLVSLISVYNILLNDSVIATPTFKISKRSPDQEPSENIILKERDIQQGRI